MSIIRRLERTKQYRIAIVATGLALLGAGCGASKYDEATSAAPKEDATTQGNLPAGFSSRFGTASSVETFETIGVDRWDIEVEQPDATLGSRGTFLGRDQEGHWLYAISFQVLDDAVTYWLNGTLVESDAQREQIARVLPMLATDLDVENATIAYSHSGCGVEWNNARAANAAYVAALIWVGLLCNPVTGISVGPCAAAIVAFVSAQAWVQSASEDYACCSHLTPDCPMPNPPGSGGEGDTPPNGCMGSESCNGCFCNAANECDCAG